MKTSRSSDYKFKKGAASESHERDIYIHKENQLSDKKIVAVGTIKAKYTADLSQALTDVQKEMFEI